MEKVVKNSNGSYSFVKDDVVVSNDLKVRCVKKENGIMVVGDIILPDNSLGKKSISTTRFKDGVEEVCLDSLSVRSSSGSGSGSVSHSSHRLNWMDFVEGDDKLILEEIRQRAEVKMNRKHIEDQIEATKKVLEELYGKLDIKM
jgi:hypothetical protein